mmetsp:Transcript_16301/g.43045  ORF Transcript_16301/g.43045 Transcript_16301/m.43045 type:complete len:285 (+) Transcript_16301:804-1658(+)
MLPRLFTKGASPTIASSDLRASKCDREATTKLCKFSTRLSPSTPSALALSNTSATTWLAMGMSAPWPATEAATCWEGSDPNSRLDCSAAAEACGMPETICLMALSNCTWDSLTDAWTATAVIVCTSAGRTRICSRISSSVEPSPKPCVTSSMRRRTMSLASAAWSVKESHMISGMLFKLATASWRCSCLSLSWTFVFWIKSRISDSWFCTCSRIAAALCCSTSSTCSGNSSMAVKASFARCSFSLSLRLLVCAWIRFRSIRLEVSAFGAPPKPLLPDASAVGWQ